MAITAQASTSWERMYQAVEQVKERLARSVAALEAANIPYAVIGGNAVANWVTRIDPGAERFTKDVDLLVRESDLEAIIRALESAGFKYHHTWGVHAFADGDTDRISDGIHLLFENQRVKPNSITTIPSLAESERGDKYQILSLESLVRMKLEANRRKDGMHLVDLMNVKLIDETWPAKYPSPLKERLEEILNDENEKFGFQ